MKRFSAMIFAMLFVLAGCEPSKSASYAQMTQSEAMALMEREKNYIILDVRSALEFDSGHIPGAICVPVETIKAPSVPELGDKAQLILVYCRSGNRSKQAAQKLCEMGYTRVVEFGGINTWPGPTVTSDKQR